MTRVKAAVPKCLKYLEPLYVVSLSSSMGQFSFVISCVNKLSLSLAPPILWRGNPCLQQQQQQHTSRISTVIGGDRRHAPSRLFWTECVQPRWGSSSWRLGTQGSRRDWDLKWGTANEWKENKLIKEHIKTWGVPALPQTWDAFQPNGNNVHFIKC